MSHQNKTPERIWANYWNGVSVSGTWSLASIFHGTEYVRADIHAAMKAKLDNVAAALIDRTRERNDALRERDEAMTEVERLKPLLESHEEPQDNSRLLAAHHAIHYLTQAEIEAAHPLKSGRHDTYGAALVMVGERHAKYDLVELVNALLIRGDEARAKLAAANDLLLQNERLVDDIDSEFDSEIEDKVSPLRDEIERLGIQVKQADERGDEALRRAHKAEEREERLRIALESIVATQDRFERETGIKKLGGDPMTDAIDEARAALADTEAKLTKAWCMRMAELEGDSEIGAGLLAMDQPEHKPAPEVDADEARRIVRTRYEDACYSKFCGAIHAEFSLSPFMGEGKDEPSAWLDAYRRLVAAAKAKVMDKDRGAFSTVDTNNNWKIRTSLSDGYATGQGSTEAEAWINAAAAIDAAGGGK